MTWLAKIPGWVKGAAVAFVVTLVLCNVIGRPDNPPNPAADSLDATREAYRVDTLRLLALLDSLKAEEARERAAKEAEIAKLAAAERRVASSRVAVDAAKRVLAAATTMRDSLTGAIDVIAKQGVQIFDTDTALVNSKAAFARLTAENALTIRRAETADTGWTRARVRLGLAEVALAIEKKRTGCTIDLVFKEVKCPSRGVVAVGTAVVTALAYSQLQRTRP